MVDVVENSTFLRTTKSGLTTINPLQNVTVSKPSLNLRGLAFSERQGKADTDKCLWSRPKECKTDAPKFPCQKNPKKWPAKIDRVAQRKTYAINYMHEELKYVERVSNQ